MPPKPIKPLEKGPAAIWFWIAQSPVADTVRRVRKVRKALEDRKARKVKASSG